MNVLGYKGMDKNMRCRGMQYEVGKTYSVKGELRLCEYGMHFCKHLPDVFNFYARDGGNRFFLVYASGDIRSDGTKCVTNKLTVLRELSKREINRYIYGCGYGYGCGNGYGYGDGYGYGYGCGYGYGDGYGYGCGNGYGYGDGYGYGYGYGCGNGYGCGCGNGDGYGYGDGNGNGNGNGNGYGNGGIQKIAIFKEESK